MGEYEGDEGFEHEGWYEDTIDGDDAEVFEQDCLARDYDAEWGDLVEDGYLDAVMEDRMSGLDFADVEF